MGIGRNVLLAMSKSPFLNHHASNRAFVKRAVKKFMPGEAPEDALTASATLLAEGRGTILTKLGENLTRLDEADAVREHYVWMFDQVKARGLTMSQISVKPTQLGLDQSPERCGEHLDTLAAKALATGSFLWIDMEDSSYVDRTLTLYTNLKKKYDKTGLALQAYLMRTPADLEKLFAVKPVIRLVKGAYAEPANIAFAKKSDTDQAYYQLSVRMLERAAKGECTPIFGTHDVPLLERIIARARELNVADGKYEIHMLYGIRDAEQRRLRGEGRVVKTLISYGSSWFKWYMRRLAERPANVWFVIRSLV